MGDGVRLVILGKQGAGKGTQAEALAQHYGIPRISTGDMFRAAVRSGSDAGTKAKVYLDAGELVPDDVVLEVIGERLAQDDAESGFVLDGFPRTVAQAEALESMLAPDDIDLVIELDVPLEVVLERLAVRRVCVDCGTPYSLDQPPKDDWICDSCGGKVVQREDDIEAAITRRLALYDQETKPLVTWYLSRDRLAAIDGTGSPDTVTHRVLRGLESRLGPQG